MPMRRLRSSHIRRIARLVGRVGELLATAARIGTAAPPILAWCPARVRRPTDRRGR
jgi:hypothetical protein